MIQSSFTLRLAALRPTAADTNAGWIGLPLHPDFIVWQKMRGPLSCDIFHGTALPTVRSGKRGLSTLPRGLAARGATRLLSLRD